MKNIPPAPPAPNAKNFQYSTTSYNTLTKRFITLVAITEDDLEEAYREFTGGGEFDRSRIQDVMIVSRKTPNTTK